LREINIEKIPVFMLGIRQLFNYQTTLIHPNPDRTMKAMNGLTHTQIVELKRQLEKEDARIREIIHQDFVARGATNGSAVLQYRETTDDDAVVDILNDADISTITRATRSLEAIEHSLKAIANETYGECEDCARHIGFKRLNANPTATLCMPCQTKREKNTAHASL
jgi:DnaK suppressor protein